MGHRFVPNKRFPRRGITTEKPAVSVGAVVEFSALDCRGATINRTASQSVKAYVCYSAVNLSELRFGGHYLRLRSLPVFVS